MSKTFLFMDLYFSSSLIFATIWSEISFGATSVMIVKILLTNFLSLLESLDIPVVTKDCFFEHVSCGPFSASVAFFLSSSDLYFLPMLLCTSAIGDFESVSSNLSSCFLASSASFFAFSIPN